MLFNFTLHDFLIQFQQTFDCNFFHIQSHRDLISPSWWIQTILCWLSGSSTDQSVLFGYAQTALNADAIFDFRPHGCNNGLLPTKAANYTTVQRNQFIIKNRIWVPCMREIANEWDRNGNFPVFCVRELYNYRRAAMVWMCGARSRRKRLGRTGRLLEE